MGNYNYFIRSRYRCFQSSFHKRLSPPEQRPARFLRSLVPSLMFSLRENYHLFSTLSKSRKPITVLFLKWLSIWAATTCAPSRWTRPRDWSEDSLLSTQTLLSRCQLVTKPLEES